MMNKSGQGSIADTLTKDETLKRKVKHWRTMFHNVKMLIVSVL